MCFDFWTVKNLTGRFLAGLRYRSYFEEDGKEVWIYETIGAEDKLGKFN